MQRFENYGLLGSRPSGPSEAELRAQSVLADAMLTRCLDDIAKRTAEREAKEQARWTRPLSLPRPASRRDRRAEVVPARLGMWERRGGATFGDW
jgi:hypothetical protein